MRKSIFLTIVVIVSTIFLSIISCKGPENTREPILKLGKAEITIQIKGVNEGQINVFVETAPIYSGTYENTMFKLKQINDTAFVYNGIVAIEQQDEIVGITIDGEQTQLGILATISQETPTIISLDFDDILNSIKTTQNEDILKLSELGHRQFLALDTLKYYGIEDSLYSNWNAVRGYQIDSLLPIAMEVLDINEAPETIKGLILNNFKIRYASSFYTPYTAIAKYNGVDVEAPPMEAWSWLNTLDYSDNMVKHLPYAGLKPFLSTILRFAGGGLEPIGDTPVVEWKKYAVEALRPAIEEPTDLLLDLLSGMSYILQIEKEEQPLTETQLKNIENAYPDDLGLIIKQYNDLLLEGDENIIDLSNENFSLIQYVDREYPGQPVVVDTWNTWCLPCLSAISQIATISSDLPENVVYLYISDVTSGEKEWKQKSREIHGYSVRINSESRDRMGEEFNLTGFPSYILIDKNHKVTYAKTGFPGLEGYKQMVNKLTE